MPAHYEAASHHHNKLVVNQNTALQVKVTEQEQQLLRVIQQLAEQNSKFNELLRQQGLKHQQHQQQLTTQVALLEARVAEVSAKSEGLRRVVSANNMKKQVDEKTAKLEKNFSGEIGDVQNKVGDLLAKMVQLSDSHEVTRKEVSSVQDDLKYVEKSITPQPPFAFTVSRFSERKFNKEPFVSPPFYTHLRGYKVCVRVDLHGTNNHVAVHCCIMRGEHDEGLGWPFRGDIHIHIQNQLRDNYHYMKVIKYDDTTGENKARKVVTGHMNYLHGFNQFIAHKDLGLDQANNCQYLKGDAIDFEVTVVVVRS
jgi:outer membrane murein-binding lipoprotein Lpp